VLTLVFILFSDQKMNSITGVHTGNPEWRSDRSTRQQGKLCVMSTHLIS